MSPSLAKGVLFFIPEQQLDAHLAQTRQMKLVFSHLSNSVPTVVWWDIDIPVIVYINLFNHCFVQDGA